jgi:hypothetical protein
MVAVEKDLDALHKEYDQLGTKISRFSVLTLAAVFFFVISFSHSCKTLVNDPEVKTRLCHIQALNQSSAKLPADKEDISDGLKALPLQLSSCPTPTPTPEPASTPVASPGPSPSPQPTVVAVAKKTGTQAKPSPSVDTRTEDEKKLDTFVAQANQQSARDAEETAQVKASNAAMIDEALSLKDRTVTIFTKEVSLLGFKIDINLLYCAPLFPLLFLMAQSYIFILRAKQDLLRCIAAQTIQKAEVENVTKLDNLVFSSSAARLTPYNRHPAWLQSVLYALGLFVISLYFVASCIYFWRHSPATTIIAISIFVANTLWIIVFYTIAYTQYVSGRLAAQVKTAFDCEVPTPLIRRVWADAQEWVGSVRLGLRFRPRVSLLTGSLLVLSTLFLATASSCEGPRKGYEFFAGINEARWFMDDSGAFSEKLLLGRTVYVMSVALAGITLLLLLAALVFRDVLRRRRLMAALFLVSGTASLFLIAELGFVYLLNLWVMADLLRLIYWVIPLLLWYWFGFIFWRRGRERWPRIRAALVLFYLPGFVICLEAFYEIIQSRLYGIVVFFAGINILSLTYMQLAARSRLPDELNATPIDPDPGRSTPGSGPVQVNPAAQ